MAVIIGSTAGILWGAILLNLFGDSIGLVGVLTFVALSIVIWSRSSTASVPGDN